MLQGHDIARLRLELAADLATPRAVFEGLMQPGRLLNRRNVLPGLVVAWTVSMMQRIEDTKLRLSRSIQDLHHMRNTLIRFCDGLHAVPYFATFGNEIVIGIDDEKCSDLFVKFRFAMFFPPMACDVVAQLCRRNGIRRHSGHFCRRGECRRILPDELLHTQRPLPR